MGAQRRGPITTGVLASIAVGVGAFLTTHYLPAVTTEVEKIGQGANWVTQFTNWAEYNMILAVGAAVAALIPIMFSSENCRKSMFGNMARAQNCCDSIRNCFLTLIGVWLVTLIEVVLFFNVIWQLAVSFIFAFTMGIFFLTQYLCVDTGSKAAAIALVSEISNSTQGGVFSDFVSGLNVTTFCTGHDETAFVNARLVFGAGMVCLIGMIISFMSVGRAKECISLEIQSIRSEKSLDELETELVEDGDENQA